MPPPSLTSCRVAVVGAGPAGLVAARELRKEGHEVVVFEKDDQIGGTWVYSPQVESDLLGIDPIRPVIHSSVYESLRTNLPRESMGFSDYPFVVREGDGRDPRRFPGHREVLLYLQDFTRKFRIEEMVRFNSEVVKVEMVDDDNGKWKLKSKRKKRTENDTENSSTSEFFDAVVVCSGHHTQPNVADIPGINSWPGKQIHSHNYRTPEPFKDLGSNCYLSGSKRSIHDHDKVTVIIGNATSAADLSMEIAGVAKEVHIASRSVPDDTCERQPGFDNMWLHSTIKCSQEDGTVVFQDGSVIVADIILHCTGYKYHFPFLETHGIVTEDDNRLGPLYKHVFPPVLAPWLSFVGIPWKVIPFPLLEFQSKWIAGVLSGRILLPSQEEMMEDVNNFYSTLEASGMPKRYTHNLFDYQAEYNNWLSAQCQCPSFEEWKKQMYYLTRDNWIARPKTYRDQWEDDHLILEAHEDFKNYI